MADITRLVHTGDHCTTCGTRTVYAAMVRIFAWGVEGGSSDIDHYECSTCEREWAA